jgi:cytochrome P450
MLRWAEDHGMFSLGRETMRGSPPGVGRVHAARVRRMDDQIREVVERTAAPLRGRYGEVIDLLGEFANVVPNTVISRITGVPPGDDEVRFRQIAQIGRSPASCRSRRSTCARSGAQLPGALELGARAGGEAPRASGRRPRDRSRERPGRGRTLCEDDIVLLLAGLIGAGSETTSQGGVSLVRMLLAIPPRWSGCAATAG